MATTLRSYIFIAFVVCCVSFAILVTSIATASWVESTLISYKGDETNVVVFGLFLGTLTSYAFTTPRRYSIHMACMADENICIWSCRRTAEEREDELHNLYTAANASFGCIEEKKALGRSIFPARKRERWGKLNSHTTTENPTLRYPVDKRYLNLGVWGSTLVSLIITIILSGIAATATIINTATNPVRTIMAIPGLYIWNGLTAFFAVLTLIIWGSHFADSLSENVGVREIITGEFTAKSSSLGFSYWIILGSALLHIANICILYFREVMLLRIPEAPKVQPTEDTDGTLFLY